MKFFAVRDGPAPEAQKTRAMCGDAFNDYTANLSTFIGPIENLDPAHSWLSVSPTSIKGLMGITVSVDPVGLKEGVYFGHVLIDKKDQKDPERITITLVVEAPPSTKSISVPHDISMSVNPEDPYAAP